MVKLSDDLWAKMGKAIAIDRKTVRQVAWEHKVDIRTLERGLERLAASGSFLPKKPGNKKGKVLREARKLTLAQEQCIKPLIKENRPKEEQYTAAMLQQDLKLGNPVCRTTIARYIATQGGKLIRVAHKENYSPEERAKRVRWAKRHKGWSEDKWMKTVFLDEHHTVYASGNVACRQLNAFKQ